MDAGSTIMSCFSVTLHAQGFPLSLRLLMSGMEDPRALSINVG